MSDTKKCSKCGEVKGLGEFGRNSATKDGLQIRCKTCYAAYVAANRESISQAKKKYALNNQEKVAAAKAKWLQENIDVARAKQRARRKSAYWENPDRYKELARLDAVKNPDKHRERHKLWKAKNPDKVNTHVDRMTDGYVAYAMRLKVSDVTPELIALKREQLTIKRMARELKKAATKATGENE